MNVARLNMSHIDHASHQKTIDLVKEYNAQFNDRVIAIMLDTKVNLEPFVLAFVSMRYIVSVFSVIMSYLLELPL